MEKLKSEIFDLIRGQDALRLRYAEIEKIKQEKLKELEVKEKEWQRSQQE